jgi:hypothetical protein
VQRLTDAPRQGLTEDQVRHLLVLADTQWTAGAELVTSLGRLDISDDLVGGGVDWSGDQDVHRSCQIGLTRELAWGRDQVALFMVGTDPASTLSARFDVGVFVLSTPQQKVGETPATFDVTGEDRLALLARPRSDVTTVTAGTGYLAAAKALIDAAATGGVVRFDGTAQDKVLPVDGDMSWRLTESEQPTTLRIVNEILDAVGYGHVWCDAAGDFRASPLAPDATRPVELAFDADDPVQTIVGLERTVTFDAWHAFNAWRFIASGLSFPPEEGNGMYTPPVYQSGGPSSIDALGLTNTRVEYLQAVDQAALVAQGDAIVAADKRVAWQLDMTSYPFPLAGHRDVVTYADSKLGGLRKLVGKSWHLDLGQPGQAPADTTWTFEQA